MHADRLLLAIAFGSAVLSVAGACPDLIGA